MILEYIFADNSREIIDLKRNIEVSDKWVNINLKSKLEFIKEFLPAFYNGQKIVLFDQNHKQLVKFHQENDINSLELIDEVNKENQLLFFTSGSSGFPLGAFKSRRGLEKEIIELKQLVEKYQVKKVIVTVPFVHIYGVLAGLLLPYALDNVTLVVKDDFLPYELLEESKEKNTLVITTPVFIKSLAKLSESKDLSSSIFISSTGPIHMDDVNAFREKYKSDIMQIFGSTETAGIAYKLNGSSKWIPFSKVNVTTENEKLSVSSPFISSYILKEKILKLDQPFVTEDIIELDSEGFTLVGRSNK
ncbi:AMP-binding protein, partial [Sulfurimonas sp.]|nr:AMP-binding protein [Sulfurimonas sp.]